MFVHVNEHDKAYRWAEGRRVKLDTATNRIRIVEEIEQTQVEVDNQLEETGLFSDFKDKKFSPSGSPKKRSLLLTLYSLNRS